QHVEDSRAVGSRWTHARTRWRAALLLLLRAWHGPDGAAARCRAALSSRTPRRRLTAARALAALAEPGAVEPFVVDLVNDRGDQPDWKIPGPTVDALAEFLVHGAPQLRARTARLLRHFNDKEQAAFDQAWAVHQARFARELGELRRQAQGRRPVPMRYTTAQIRELAFG